MSVYSTLVSHPSRLDRGLKLSRSVRRSSARSSPRPTLALLMALPLHYEDLIPRVRGLLCPVPGCKRLLKNSTGYNQHLVKMHPGYQTDAGPTFLNHAGLTFPGPAFLFRDTPGSPLAPLSLPSSTPGHILPPSSPLVHQSVFDHPPSTPESDSASLPPSSPSSPFTDTSPFDHLASTPERQTPPAGHFVDASTDSDESAEHDSVLDGLQDIPCVPVQGLITLRLMLHHA